MPTLKLAGRSTGTPARKSPARTAPPKRKPAAAAASKAPARKPAASTRKPAAAAAATSNGGGTRGPKLPEGWSKADLNRVIKDMQKAKASKEAAADKLAEAQALVNGLAIELLDQGVQMSLVSTELELSRQWMYTMLKKRDEEAAAKKASRSRNRTSKPAAAAPVAKKRPGAKPAAKTAPARKRPAAPAGRGRIRIAA